MKLIQLSQLFEDEVMYIDSGLFTVYAPRAYLLWHSGAFTVVVMMSL